MHLVLPKSKRTISEAEMRLIRKYDSFFPINLTLQLTWIETYSFIVI